MPAVVHKGERILTAADNAQIAKQFGNIGNQELIAILPRLSTPIDKEISTAPEKLQEIKKSFDGYDLDAFIKRLPSFDVGTAYVPNDMVAKVHKGERILTAQENQDFSRTDNSNQSRTVNLTQHFHFTAPPSDRKSQSQLAYQVGMEGQRALNRNG
jgi:hypothetical protein